MPHPLLPNIRSELAVPLMVGGLVLGVLDVQADVTGYFTAEEVRIQTTLAAQIAVALQNAYQYEQTQAALASVQQSQELLRTIIDATPDWIFIKDKQHRYQMVNRGYAEALQLAPANFVGKNDLDLGFPEDIVKGNPEKGIRGFWQHDLDAMEGGDTIFVESEPAIYKGQLHYQSTIKVPLRHHNGEVWGVLGFVRDITQRERLLQEAEKLYEVGRRLNQAGSLADIVAAITETLAIPVINRAELFLFERNAAHQLQMMTVTAAWHNGVGTPPRPVGTRYSGQTGLVQNLLLRSEPCLVDDIQAGEQIDTAVLAQLQSKNTQSLAILPLWVGLQQVGSLLFEAEEIYEFTEDDRRLMRAMAEQVAVAVENQRLLQETRAALTEVEAIQRRYTVQSWAAYRARKSDLSHEQVRPGVEPLGVSLRSAIRQMLAPAPSPLDDSSPQPSRRLQTIDVRPHANSPSSLPALAGQPGVNGGQLLVPLAVRGQTIGLLGLQENVQAHRWSPEEVALVEAIAEQMAQVAENLRLIDETQQRAAREQVTRQITDRIRASRDIETALKTATAELSQALGASRAVVNLQVEATDGQEK
jgi:PAS domain S-box-containing protein